VFKRRKTLTLADNGSNRKMLERVLSNWPTPQPAKDTKVIGLPKIAGIPLATATKKASLYVQAKPLTGE